ncbi:amidohydrolase family protein [Streptomyces sp. GbtcB7]|uniref:amidohydrolase family protein n=1 Tax=Streptomyces sp. GbtcB7 TaxID=2824752 RepID=UPI001C2F2804|nr:amidohydrolase family protein [Streptomyces sp. GbtcB7]
MAVDKLPVGRPIAAPALPKISIEEHLSDPANTSTDYSFMARAGAVSLEFAETVMRRMRDVQSTRIEEMDEAGIEVQVLSLTTPGSEGIRDAAESVKAAQRVNDYIAEQVREGAGRFQGLATVPLQDTDAAIAELRRAVQDLDLRGVMVSGFVDIGDDEASHYLDEDRFDAFWEALAELNVPLYLHPRPSVDVVRQKLYQGREELAGATWGFASETATHALRIAYGGVFDRHPKAQLILGHMGETIGFFSWRIQRAFEYNPGSARPEKRLQDYLSENFWFTTSGAFNDQALINSILTVGADRILFAVDYPFEMSPDGARWIETAPISENDRRKIAYGNSAKLFGIKSV